MIRRQVMTAIRAIYDGNVFIPEKPCEITKGSKVTLTINLIDIDSSEKQKRLSAFRQLTKEIKELNETDPLPLEFDDIISKRVQIREMSN
jgi:predicted DNA-binding antitoxin AbrB/MazE fold protein